MRGDPYGEVAEKSHSKRMAASTNATLHIRRRITFLARGSPRRPPATTDQHRRTTLFVRRPQLSPRCSSTRLGKWSLGGRDPGAREMEIRRGQALLQTVTASGLRPKPPFPNRPRPSSSLRLRGVTPEQSPILSYFIRVAYGWSDLLLFFPLRWRGVPLRFLTRIGDLHLKAFSVLFLFYFRDISHTRTHIPLLHYKGKKGTTIYGCEDGHLFFPGPCKRVRPSGVPYSSREEPGLTALTRARPERKALTPTNTCDYT